MARRVKKRRKSKAPEVEFSPRDYQPPEEKRVYWQGVVGIIGVFVIAAYNVMYFGVGPPLNREITPDAALYGQWWWPVILIVLPVLTWGIANWLALRSRWRRIKEEGPNARVLNKNHPRLKAMLSEQARLLGIEEPEMYIIDDDTPYLYSLPGKPGTVIATQAILDSMNDEQTAVLLARELGHLKSKHARMTIVTTFMRRAHIGIRIALFPMWLLSMFMRGWIDLAEITADRVAILVSERPALVNETLVKLAVTADREAEISSEDLEAYLDAGMDQGADSAQMERHFRFGAFLRNQETLRERIEEITEFLKTDQGQEALEKIREVKQRIA